MEGQHSDFGVTDLCGRVLSFEFRAVAYGCRKVCRKSCDMGPNFPFLVFRSRKPCFWFCLGKVATFPSNFFGVGLGKIRPNFSRGKVARKLGFHCTHSSQKQSPKQLTRCVTVTQRSPLTFFSLFRFLSFQPIRSLATENVFLDFPRKLVAKKANFPP